MGVLKELEIGPHELSLMRGELRFGLESSQPFGGLPVELQGQPSQIDLLPSDVVNDDMQGRSVDLGHQLGHFGRGRRFQASAPHCLDIDLSHPGLLRGQDVLCQTGAEILDDQLFNRDGPDGLSFPGYALQSRIRRPVGSVGRCRRPPRGFMGSTGIGRTARRVQDHRVALEGVARHAIGDLPHGAGWWLDHVDHEIADHHRLARAGDFDRALPKGLGIGCPEPRTVSIAQRRGPRGQPLIRMGQQSGYEIQIQFSDGGLVVLEGVDPWIDDRGLSRRLRGKEVTVSTCSGISEMTENHRLLLPHCLSDES